MAKPSPATRAILGERRRVVKVQRVLMRRPKVGTKRQMSQTGQKRGYTSERKREEFCSSESRKLVNRYGIAEDLERVNVR